MFLFGKDISIQTSLDKWESSLITNTLTDYDQRVAQEALRISEKGSRKDVSQTPAAAAAQTPNFFAEPAPEKDKERPQSARNAASAATNEMEETKREVLEA